VPSVSKKQQQFFGAELRRKRAGKKGKTEMSEEQVEEFAATKHAGLPKKAKAKKK